MIIAFIEGTTFYFHVYRGQTFSFHGYRADIFFSWIEGRHFFFNGWSQYIFFTHGQGQNIFFGQNQSQNIFFKKTQAPPWESNGRSLIVASEEMHSIDFYSGSREKNSRGGGVQFEILKKSRYILL